MAYERIELCTCCGVLPCIRLPLMKYGERHGDRPVPIVDLEAAAAAKVKDDVARLNAIHDKASGGHMVPHAHKTGRAAPRQPRTGG